MSIPFLISIDLNNNEILNFLLQQLATDPSPIEAKIYYNTTDKRVKFHNGTVWKYLDSIDIASEINGSNEKTTLVNNDLFGIVDSADGNKLKKVKWSNVKYTHPNHTGDVTSLGDGTTTIADKAVTLAKMADLTKGTMIGRTNDSNGVPQALTVAEIKTLLNYAPSDINLGNVTNNAQVKKSASSTDGNIPTWNGTTGDALGAGYSVETTLTGGTGAIPRADAVKTYVDALLGASDAMVYKGVINASTNPNYPAADAGHTYKISVAGKIGGASGIAVEVGDMIICTVDGTAAGNHATVGANWNIIQVNIDGAIIGIASSVNNNFVAFDGTSGKLIKDSGYNSGSFAPASHNHDGSYPKKYTQTIGNGTLKTFTITHNLNTFDFTFSLRKTNAPREYGFVSMEATTENTATVTFGNYTPANNEFTVVFIG